jgi:hypothetical protein
VTTAPSTYEEETRHAGERRLCSRSHRGGIVARLRGREIREYVGETTRGVPTTAADGFRTVGEEAEPCWLAALAACVGPRNS